jgi:hypothetical protein
MNKTCRASDDIIVAFLARNASRDSPSAFLAVEGYPQISQIAQIKIRQVS